MTENKIIKVGAAWVFKDQKMLLCHNLKYQNVFKIPYMSPPAGKRNPGEKLRDCIKRETKEEAGLEVVVDELVSVQQRVLPHGFFQLYSCLCYQVGGKLQTEEPENIASVNWYNHDQLVYFMEEGILATSVAQPLAEGKLEEFFVKRY